MPMIKRARSGKIEETMDKNSTKPSDKKREVLADIKLDTPETPEMEWSDVVIKDVLDVPTTVDASIDVDLEEDDGDEIAVRV